MAQQQLLLIARVYLDVEVIADINRAEQIAQESLQVFQNYKCRQLTAAVYKLLGEIYLKRMQSHQSAADSIASQFLEMSQKIYHELDMQEKAIAVEQLKYNIPISTNSHSD